MIMSPGARKLALTTHVACSVGWLGSVAVFLALAVIGLASEDAPLVRAVYRAMEPVTWLVIVPLSLASLATGLVQSLGTTWGLFRHYWVVVKLALTILATLLLLLHTRPIGYLADVAAEGAAIGGELGRLRIQLVADATGALLLLLMTTALSVYKPRGMTPYGQRKERAQRRAAASVSTP